jgi:DNA-binding transcriptional MerR regulator
LIHQELDVAAPSSASAKDDLPMKIGELAHRAGVGIDTVRHYERQGLLPAPARQPSGYRTYSQIDLVRLRFVRRARALGFSLEEIGSLLALSELRAEDVGELRSIASAKLAQVESRMAELARMRDALRRMTESHRDQGAVDLLLHALDEDP